MSGRQDEYRLKADAPEISFLDVATLLATEAFKEACVRDLVRTIIREGIWRTPICVERIHGVVMDGHHRLEAARRLGLQRIPCLVFEYNDVCVRSRRSGLSVTPAAIIERGLSRHVYPHKTTKHVFPCDLPVLAIPIELLKTASSKEGQL